MSEEKSFQDSVAIYIGGYVSSVHVPVHPNDALLPYGNTLSLSVPDIASFHSLE